MVLSKIRALLVGDTDITKSAKHFKLDPDRPFLELEGNVAEFYLLQDTFEAWREKHQRSISTNFVLVKRYQYNDPDNQHRISYECQRAGKKRVHKGNIKGGKSGKPRISGAGIKSDCPSRLAAIFRPIEMPDGSRSLDMLFGIVTNTTILLATSLTLAHDKNLLPLRLRLSD